jgi:molybdopterin-guanine dinucleotide biosynthesis protein A
VPQLEGSVAAVVLAGGKNARLGGVDKGLLRFQGVPLVVRTAELLAGLFEEVILVTNSADGYPGLPAGLLLTADRYAGRGPLAGIQAGLARSAREAAFCVACDMPFLSAEIIREQIRRFREEYCDVLLPRVGGQIEPLHAVYRRSLLPAIERLLSDGGGNSIRRLYPAVRTANFELEDTAATRAVFTNINTPEDVERICGR